MEGPRVFSGPMVVLTGVVAVAWFVMAAACLLGLEGTPRLVLGAVGVVGGLATVWLARAMRVPWDDHGLVLPRWGHVPWSAIDAIEVRPGLVSVPVLWVREGRALSDVRLDGLAWFGGAEGRARTLAERVAQVAGLDEVLVRVPGAGRGRRALP